MIERHSVPAAAEIPKIAFVSLGCPKDASRLQARAETRLGYRSAQFDESHRGFTESWCGAPI
jgi:hypothetical protein